MNATFWNSISIILLALTSILQQINDRSRWKRLSRDLMELDWYITAITHDVKETPNDKN